MTVKKLNPLFSFLFFLVILTGCTTNVVTLKKAILTDGKYDGDLPYADASGSFEKIIGSVKLINSMAFFEGYIFSKSQRITFHKNGFDKIKNKALQVEHFHDTYAGTGTVIYADNSKALLLTCAHVLDFPDTSVTYFLNDDGSQSQYVESIVVKVKQTNYLPELSDGVVVNVLAKDRDLDLALVGNSFDMPNLLKLRVLDFPIGNPAELNWGSLVYLFGYPLNNKLITRGLVSKPRKDAADYFLIDAVVNRGFSGGPVFAIRDGIPNFELVGIIKSTFAEKRFLLKPADQKSFNPNIPYTGKLYVKKDFKFKYGVSRVVPIDKVIEFIRKNKQALLNKGFYVEKFFKNHN